MSAQPWDDRTKYTFKIPPLIFSDLRWTPYHVPFRPYRFSIFLLFPPPAHFSSSLQLRFQDFIQTWSLPEVFLDVSQLPPCISFLGDCSKSPTTGCLIATEIYSLRALEIRSLKSRGWEGHAPSGTSRRQSFLRWLLTFLGFGNKTLISASIFACPFPHMSVSSPLPSILGTHCHWIKTNLNPGWSHPRSST